MSNKKIFNSFDKIKMSENKKEEILQNIISQKPNMKRRVSNMNKFILIPTGLVVILFALVTLSGNKPYVDTPIDKVEMNNEINVNKITEIMMSDIDVNAVRINCDVKNVEGNTALEYINAIQIPKGLEIKGVDALYFRKDRNAMLYDVLGDISIHFNNGIDKSISIAFSEGKKPARDYFILDDEYTKSKINNIETIILNYEDIYIAELNVKNIYYDIETRGISETELVELIENIIDSDLEKIIEIEKNTEREYKIFEAFDIEKEKPRD